MHLSNAHNLENIPGLPRASPSGTRWGLAPYPYQGPYGWPLDPTPTAGWGIQAACLDIHMRTLNSFPPALLLAPYF